MKRAEHIISAAFTFSVSLIVYVVTLSPTVSLWDCGEFITCAVTMGIPHPPGAPLYLMVGKVFSMLPFGPDDAYRVNMISALSTALAVMFLYLIIVILIKTYRGEPKGFTEKMSVYGGGVLGALTFAFTDTLWFNAVESEVYAPSILFTALTLWFALKWMENRETPSSLRYLLACVYIAGLATGVHLLNILVLPTILFLVSKYKPDLITSLIKNSRLRLIVLVLLCIGWTSYLMIYTRAGLGPVINENDPSNWERFYSYWNREQYGTESLFASMFSRKAPLWIYQVKKMYLRYFAWNFIGQGTTLGPDKYIIEIFSPKGLFYMPFLLGIAGVWHHFKNDLPRAFAILILFIFTGILIVLYLNQPDPQPRERDYVYVGSFFAFSIWIGIGMSWLIAKVGEIFRKSRKIQKPAVLAAFSLCFFMGPALEFDHNFDSHDRRGNYMAWDYAYNILQSCEQNGIIFTNGDNDTFPIWYLQEVENIRKDVNIINLSLLNTNWYIKQLKYGNPAVPITLSDTVIETIAPRAWTERSVTVPVPASAYNDYSKDVHEIFDLQEITSDTEISFTKTSTFTTSDGSQTGLRVQDIMLEHIIRANNWERPVYIAMTVSENNKLGLQEYLRTDGLAFKLVPFSSRYLAVERLTSNIVDVFRYRGYNEPGVYFNRTQKDMLQNLRVAFLEASNFYSTNQMVEEAARILDEMELRIPAEFIPYPDYRTLLQIAQLYFRNNNIEKVHKILEKILVQYRTDIQSKKDVARVYAIFIKDYKKASELLTEYLQVNPFEPEAYSLLISALREDNKNADAILYIRKWLDQYPGDSQAQSMLENIEQLQAKADST